MKYEVEQIIPGGGYVAVYSQRQEPYYWTTPVVAWGIVRRFDDEGLKTVESVSVEALVPVAFCSTWLAPASGEPGLVGVTPTLTDEVGKMLIEQAQAGGRP